MKNNDDVTQVCDHDWVNPSCVFGCNRVVDEDTGFCPECSDHSTNVYECSQCGVEGEFYSFTGTIIPL